VINKAIGIPELASEHGALIDNMLELVHWFMAVLAIGWGIFFLYCVWRFRRSKNPKASYYGVRSHASHHIEIGVIIVEAILLLGFAYPLWAHRTAQYPTGPEVVKVRAVGQQFFWTLHYPGPDGKFGLTDPALIGPSNALGINYDDPYSKDDFLSGELVLAKDRDCIIEVTSKDVIHNLHLLPMRIQQDAIPGTVAHMWFKPTKTGTWETICGQLCGAGHAQMKGIMTVKEGKDFDQWFQESTPKAAAAPAGLTEEEPAAPAKEAASL
jgi:cytochrome c oxidase subunit 2